MRFGCIDASADSETPFAVSGRPVARGLVGTPHRPVRLRSSRKTDECSLPEKRGQPVWGGFATQRGQAPSPQVFVCLKNSLSR
ncbi:hypothetical protein PFAS1_01485 [Pseudomonas frederiksbergensis]|nr:hypothetical protein PFAS1_01485 [Pseudomonas frederiksbergensis]